MMRWTAVLIWTALTALCFVVFFKNIDLQPQVDQYFFFSGEDPQFKKEKMIAEIFPQPPQLILAAKGDIRSKDYAEKIEKLSQELSLLPETLNVQSLTRGPKNVQDAFKSPLWKRVLIAKDGKSSLIFIFIKDVPPDQIVPKVEAIRNLFNGPNFQLIISGSPYIVELIRRSLFEDLKVFTLAAFGIFSVVLLIMFRSIWIVVGTAFACFNASAVTIMISKALNVQIGFLTANLSTIIFVLTLSHILFLTASWKHVFEESLEKKKNPAMEAVKDTFWAAMCSTFTALLGFLTLLFVQAQALRQLGIAGSIGSVVSFVAAYGIYPWFLSLQTRKPATMKGVGMKRSRISFFFRRSQILAAVLLIALFIFSLFGLKKLNTDPDLFSYFKAGSELRKGLEYIDQNGGSNPFNLVVTHPGTMKFDSKESYAKLWDLQLALENDPAVGHVVSLPIILGEAKRSKIGRFLSNKWLLNILDKPQYGEITQYFVTDNRNETLFFLRMNEMGRTQSRIEVEERIKKIVWDHGLVPVLTGGVYVLQGRLSQLVMTSLISGSFFLNMVFLVMAWLISRSIRVSLAMLAALYFVPIVMFGILGHLGIPLDVIAAPAANVAIGMGVDSMIHMTMMIRRYGNKTDDWNIWVKACARLWEPIMWSTIVVCAGFVIFALSNFPPTQRFGLCVVLGMVLTPLGALFILPSLSNLGSSFRKKKDKTPRSSLVNQQAVLIENP